jgi:hypothetical protein
VSNEKPEQYDTFSVKQTLQIKRKKKDQKKMLIQMEPDRYRSVSGTDM